MATTTSNGTAEAIPLGLEESRMISQDDELPTNVSEENQLSCLPQECLAPAYLKKSADLNDSDDDETRKQLQQQRERPLRHVDDRGNEYFYSLKPMQYSVVFILLVELFERFAFYGIYYTQTLFLTGAYNADWNAGFASVEASSFVSASTMIAYTTPFVGAYFSDKLFGDYPSLLVGLLFFYIPGVALIVSTTVPKLLGEDFNATLLTVGFLVLWPLGTGIVKSIVNVFGAKQFHPVLQSSLIESYYVSFYTVINVGALAGICIIPIVAQRNVFLAYMVPLSLLIVAGFCFVMGTPRYITTRPRRTSSGKRKGAPFLCGGGKRRTLIPKSTTLFEIFRICVLAVPFNVGYNQMPTTFVVQGSVMSKAFGLFDVASMNSLDTISVLVFGSVMANCIYPYLARNNIKIPTTFKFAIGSFLGACAVAWAIIVERMIHSTFDKTGEQVNVLWQAPSYLLIGFGEIFAVSTAYEVAFTASPPDKKVLSSATNIFCVGGLPNIICIVLVHSCRKWFTNMRGDQNIGSLEDYATAHVGKYFLVLLGTMLFGVGINLLPCVRKYVESIEERASELMKTPSLTPSLRQQRRKQEQAPLQHTDSYNFDDEENSPLLVTTPRTKKYKQYLEYGSGPIYTRSSSMRAGPSLSRSDLPGGKVKKIKFKAISKLYGGGKETRKIQLAKGADGKPIKAGSRDIL